MSRTTPQFDAMLQAYCDAMNSFDLDFEPREFTEPPYGEFTIHTPFSSDWYEVHSATIYNGDDGGPTTLIAWFERNEGMRIRYMTVEFDTEVNFIIRDFQVTKGIGA